MKMLSKILCRSIGTAGMGLVLYDAIKVGAQTSRNTAQATQGKYLEDIYYNSRTTDNMSYVSNGMRNGVFNTLTRNPLPTLWGRIKGAFRGSLYSLGNSLPLVVCSACALLSKGIIAKLGAIGATIVLCYDILRNGLGLGKHHPMN